MRGNQQLWSDLPSRCGKLMQHDQFWFHWLKSRKDTSQGFGQVSQITATSFWGRNDARSEFQLKMGH